MARARGERTSADGTRLLPPCLTLFCKAHLHQLIDDLTIGANANKLNRQKPVEHERAKIKFLARIIKRDYPVTSNMGNRIGGIGKISV